MVLMYGELGGLIVTKDTLAKRNGYKAVRHEAFIMKRRQLRTCFASVDLLVLFGW